MTAAGEKRPEVLKKSGGGNILYLFLEVLVPRPICISRPKFSKWLKIVSRNFSRSFLLSNKNYPSSTNIMKNSSNRLPELKYSGLWMTNWPLRGVISSVLKMWLL